MDLQKLVSLISSGKYEEAFKRLSRIIKRSPRNAEAWFLLSFVYQKQRQRLYALDRALKINPSYKYAAHRLEELTSGAAHITPITKYYPPEKLKKKKKRVSPARIFLNLFIIIAIGAAAFAAWTFLLSPIITGGDFPVSISQPTATLSESERQTQEAQFTQTPTLEPISSVEVILIEQESTPTPTPTPDLAAIAQQTQQALEEEEEIYSTLAAEATATQAVYATATAIVQATEAAIAAAATATAEAEAAAAAAAANQGPALDQFINQIRNGNGSQVVGIFVEGVMALRVVQQPSGNPGWVAESWGTATYFAMVKSYTGNDGLIAHNYLSGGSFFRVYGGQRIYLIYGNGNYREFVVSSFRSFQALQPNSPYSNFVDLNSGATLDSTSLFYAVYGGSLRLTLQTCINRDGHPSWGRYFVISREN